MRRREFIGIAGGVAVWPFAARAQPVKRRQIAYLSHASSTVSEGYLETFRQGLRARGYRDEDVEIEIRYADGHAERLPDLAAELVRLAPVVIVAGSDAGARAAKQATSTIPIVMVGLADPIGLGLVASLAHPGGNVTGLANLAQETVGKRLELLKTVIPGAERIAILLNPGSPIHADMLQAARQAAGTLRTELLSVEARPPDDVDGAFATMIRERADALIVPNAVVFALKRSRIVELAASNKLPAIYQSREWPVAGGMMSYGAEQNDLFRQAAAYTDKILKGAKPADLPVEQPTKFDLVINLKTAKALGLTVPQSLLQRADEIIE